jgi:hypothetical protein
VLYSALKAYKDQNFCLSMQKCHQGVKFIYSEKATKFCEISTLLLSYVAPVKGKVEISQNFVAFSEYVNFINTVGRLELGWVYFLFGS